MGARTSDAARRNTRLRFEQWAKNPACEANTISAVRNVRMARVAEAEGIRSTFGQSPFALARGDQFERGLLREDAKLLREELVECGVLDGDAKGFADFRLRRNGGPAVATLDQAIEQTEQLLAGIARWGERRRGPRPPALVAAATVRIPRGVMLPEAVLIIDAVAVQLGTDPPTLVVGEIKTYPDRGGYTDAGELAVARAQAGLYVHALDVVARQLGLDGRLTIARHGFLVLSSPGSNRPRVRTREDLRYQVERARRGFDLLERAAQQLPAGVWAVDDEAPPGELLDLVRNARTAYGEACLSFCDRAPGCFEQALRAGDPVVLGEDARRFLGTVDLWRALELIDGHRPVTEAEIDLVRRIDESDGRACR